MQILIAGFQHETNTFAPTPATYDSFVRGEGFPALCRGADVLKLRDVNIPVGGFILAAEAAGHTLKPVIWAGASPSDRVTRDAFERIVGEIVEAARRRDFEAVYLDLHGAMAAENADDGEGEILRRVRDAIGPDIPLVASLDLHANVTPLMLEQADALCAYRTYPHVDMAEAGRRAADLLARVVESGRPACAFRRLPFLIPINGMCTSLEPARGTYAALAKAEAEHDGRVALSFAPGFPAADFEGCGGTVWGYAADREEAEAAVGAIYDRIVADEPAWAIPFLAPDAAVAEAARLARDATRPVVIADTQDNPGAGGDANTTGMLRALLAHGVDGAALGLFWDPDAARQAHEAGVGATIALRLGGRAGVPGDAPFEGRFVVEALSDGRCVFDGPMMNGMHADQGPSACLRIDGVRIAVSSVKAQMLDRNLFRMVGIEPERMKILVNKSSVHFRADFEPIASAVLVAKAPGPMRADPADLPWQHLREGIRTRPCGQSFTPAPIPAETAG
ncbi:M81 family metallopeptidase [Chitinasiproducens palmae]|uniref:Microcystinase C n=1 Tax=Chitinasiproducens palmae TaxID=1770053 RepID=A0A1H2PSC2_9BURK|nr:M81 family metallopeptidase [Chitinasiproducens palmae]SDV49857.1 Microcystin degradation protein MlrC, contains DUF1485 domain [Chitinasiproducens palmae]